MIQVKDQIKTNTIRYYLFPNSSASKFCHIKKEYFAVQLLPIV